jgi:molybdopterin molybdotransferase
LLETPGRVLAEEIVADIDVPPFDNSAVDGYAVRAEDTAGATPETPVVLPAANPIMAGLSGESEALQPGTARRIMTGAPLPYGADAVVMVEDTRPVQEGHEGAVAILERAQPDQHVRRAGEDVARGETVLQPGVAIRAAEVAMLATMGRARVSVYRAPRVAVLSTGDEVVEIEQGKPPPPGMIRNSNRYALEALAREAGAQVVRVEHLPDDLEATVEVLRSCADPVGGVDAIVSAGGVSMGDRDYIRPALQRLGTLELWRVAMKPGKPLAFGTLGNVLFFGLPGNPVSAFVTFELFVRPALRRMAGNTPTDRMTVPAELTASVAHGPGRREYVRAVTTIKQGRFMTQPTGAQGSGILRSMTLANSLLIVPTESEGLQAGDTVNVLLIDSPR